jgi:hypothetical protein
MISWYTTAHALQGYLLQLPTPDSTVATYGGYKTMDVIVRPKVTGTLGVGDHISIFFAHRTTDRVKSYNVSRLERLLLDSGIMQHPT